MSTAKKKTVKFTAFVTIFILSITYFSFLSPTSAYFYKEEKKNGSVKFALFNASDDYMTVFEEGKKLEFKGATKFADFDEMLFDDVAIQKEVTVTNDAQGVPARILVNVTPSDTAVENGLKYMTFVSKNDAASEAAETDGEGQEGDVVTSVQKGELKSKIEKTLYDFDGSFVDGIDYSSGLSVLNSYNEQQKTSFVTLQPGESATVKFVFWSEYTALSQQYGDNWEKGLSVNEIDYSCKVEIIASQDNDAAVASIYKTETVDT